MFTDILDATVTVGSTRFDRGSFSKMNLIGVEDDAAARSPRA